MPVDSATRILQIISHPIRESIISSLKGTFMTFSDIMRVCGQDPNYDTGPFCYHLSILLDSGLIEKKGNEYLLTSFGNTVASFIYSLRRESNFLFKTEKQREVEKRMGNIEAKWLSQEDIDKGEHGLIAGSKAAQRTKKEKERRGIKREPTQERLKFYDWQKELPQLEMPPPSFFGHVLGFEKNGVGLGCIHLRFHVWAATDTAFAQVMGIFIADNNYRKVGETRKSVLREMMEELLRQLREHGTEKVDIMNVYSGDQDLVNVLKELAFERTTIYRMEKTLV